MENPLKCQVCGEFRYYSFKGYHFENGSKKIGMKIPIIICPSCGDEEVDQGQEHYKKIADSFFESLKDGEFRIVKFKYEDKEFKKYKHLGFKYSAEDYFFIPGLYRGPDDGFLTPVFFDKDVLLYYNNHPDYRVNLYSFSSGNISFKGIPLFSHGFGINRNGKIFFWLGDLKDDFKPKEMSAHLKRFQASNIDSDHDLYSKFYLSQLPTTYKDAFQESDNEERVFYLADDLIMHIYNIKNISLSQIKIEDLQDYYRPPIMEDREQIFNAYLTLTKYLIENIQVETLKGELLKAGKKNKDIKSLGSIKTIQMYFYEVFSITDIDTIISPLYVLYDLRLLHGHLSNKSFEMKYNTCKNRLDLSDEATDFEVYQVLIKKLINFYDIMIKLISK